MIPVAMFLLPACIAGPSDDGTFSLKSNSSDPSKTSSVLTGTLTLLIVVPLANVAVNVALLKSTPPICEALQLISNNMYIILLPLADTGDCSNGLTVTLNGLADVPPINSSNITKDSLFSNSLN